VRTDWLNGKCRPESIHSSVYTSPVRQLDRRVRATHGYCDTAVDHHRATTAWPRSSERGSDGEPPTSHFSARNHCAYGVDGRSTVEFGLRIKPGRSVRIEGLFRPFAFRGACRSHARFRHPALFAPIDSIDFTARYREIYGMYGGGVESMAETDRCIGSLHRFKSLGAGLDIPAIRHPSVRVAAGKMALGFQIVGQQLARGGRPRRRKSRHTSGLNCCIRSINGR
jgi:hypothetical protein